MRNSAIRGQDYLSGKVGFFRRGRLVPDLERKVAGKFVRIDGVDSFALAFFGLPFVVESLTVFRDGFFRDFS